MSAAYCNSFMLKLIDFLDTFGALQQMDVDTSMRRIHDYGCRLQLRAWLKLSKISLLSVLLMQVISSLALYIPIRRVVGSALRLSNRIRFALKHCIPMLLCEDKLRHRPTLNFQTIHYISKKSKMTRGVCHQNSRNQRHPFSNASHATFSYLFHAKTGNAFKE